MPNAEFLETYPLYHKLEAKRFEEDLPGSLTPDAMPRPPINMACKRCGKVQTFTMVNNYSDDLAKVEGRIDFNPSGAVVRSIYKCAACPSRIIFVLEFGDVTSRRDPKVPPNQYEEMSSLHELRYTRWVRKVGQCPEWQKRPSADLERALGAHASDYGKGQLLEQLGFALGACAYYRRMVESLTDHLLKAHEAGDGASDATFLADLAVARISTSAAELHKLARPLLAPALTEGDANPLGLAYGELSDALHGATEARVKEIAPRNRELIERIFLEIYSEAERKKSRAVVQAALKRSSTPRA